MTQDELREFLELVYTTTGIKMTEAKKTLLMNRLRKPMAKSKCNKYRDYIDLLKTTPLDVTIREDFIDAVTTNETYFFRSPKIWDYFENEYLAAWVQDSIDRPLKIWCGAASSGEEPYTIGILCKETEKKHAKFKWSLLATDISKEMIETCKLGVYSGRSIEKIHADLLQQHFSTENSSLYRVKDSVRQNIKFETHKLQDPMLKGPFDLILIRNVMIYFDKDTKTQVVNNACKAFGSKNGTLIIGESEGLIGIDTSLEYSKPCIYKFKG